MVTRIVPMAPMNLFKSVELLKNVDQTSLLVTMENVYPDIYNAQEKPNAPMGPMKNYVVSVLYLFRKTGLLKEGYNYRKRQVHPR